MKTALNMLALCRAAERETAMTKLASTRRELDQSHTLLRQAQESVAQAEAWRADLTARCELGEQNALRESALPACMALLEKEQRALKQRDAMVRLAHAHILEQRQEMLRCEHAVMRIDEWKLLRLAQDQRELSMLEDRQADDLVHQRPFTKWGNP